MKHPTYSFFVGPNLDPRLGHLVITAIDWAETLARRNPEHELLEFFTGFEPSAEAVHERFQVRFALPDASLVRRESLLGQMYFWIAYANALEVALRDPEAAKTEYAELIRRVGTIL